MNFEKHLFRFKVVGEKQWWDIFDIFPKTIIKSYRSFDSSEAAQNAAQILMDGDFGKEQATHYRIITY